jgi:hypothetical protein
MTFYPRTRRFLIGQVAIWLLFGLEVGVYYASPPNLVLTTVLLVVAGIEIFIFTALFMEFMYSPVGYGLVIYFLLALAALIVGTLDLLLLGYFGRG